MSKLQGRGLEVQGWTERTAPGSGGGEAINPNGVVILRSMTWRFGRPAKPGIVTIAGHPGVDIAKGTLNRILKQAI
jgi:hypothetical protein